MKVSQNFGIIFVLMVIIQIVLQFSPYIILSLLPAMILCLPLGIGNITAMLFAFASALTVDWLSEGLIGINAAALLPVAFCRKGIIRIFLGEDIITRKDNFSLRKYGAAKISVLLITVLVIYLGIYIILDGAGTRPMWFNTTRFLLSLACNLPLSLVIVQILMPDERK